MNNGKKYIKSEIILEVKPAKNLQENIKLHLKYLPETCLVQLRLLQIVAGYRNRVAGIFANDSIPKANFTNVVVAAFPTLVDNPDLNEILCDSFYE